MDDKCSHSDKWGENRGWHCYHASQVRTKIKSLPSSARLPKHVWSSLSPILEWVPMCVRMAQPSYHGGSQWGMHVYNGEPIENYEEMFGNYYHAHKIVTLLVGVVHVGQRCMFDTKLAHLKHALYFGMHQGKQKNYYVTDNHNTLMCTCPS